VGRAFCSNAAFNAAFRKPTMPTLPYGTWPSPLTTEALVADTLALGDVQRLPDGRVLWQEGRPQEKGRTTVMCLAPNGQRTELTPAPWNVRTRAHEYGGRSYLAAGNLLFFSHFADQRLYRTQGDAAPQALTPEVPNAALRYADLALSPCGAHLFAVREDHRGQGEAVNTLVRLAAEAKASEPDEGTVVAQGADFYAAPRLSPDGSQLVWLQWNHPNMPWDGTELMGADVQPDGRLGPTRCLAGGPTESICQPVWAPDGTLTMVSDRSGWWNLYRLPNPLTAPNAAWQALAPLAQEFGQPMWNFGQASYAYADAHTLVCSHSHAGMAMLSTLDTQTLKLRSLALPWSWHASVCAGPGEAVCVAASPTQEPSVVRISLQAPHQATVLQRGSALRADEAYTSVPEAITYPSAGGRHAHALYYPPHNAHCKAPAGETPPLIVLSHGGPTSATSALFKPSLQYWTSRGYAVLDVNYGGSTGYGRAYRDALKGQWGVVDVEDCIAGAQALVAAGRADGQRLIIRGGSAGGYTTLAALTFHRVFACGASLYGIGDLAALARDTHKFEARYLDSLIGPWPQAQALYEARSPIFHTERLHCALILFQGSEDKAVPPEQSRQMAAAVKAKGLPVAYIEFEGEGHGFRQAANIRRVVEAEETFYARVLGFTPAAGCAPLEITNLDLKG
jgi:dipeptidyl aminopeptidase/acylaminoacyl peptidase